MPHTLPASGSPVSPIQLQPLPPTPRSTSRTPNQTQTQVQVQAQAQIPAQAQSTHSSTSPQRTTWVPFTLRWYFLLLPTTISVCLGSVLIFLSLYSKRNHGIGTDDGSSVILFGWRFVPTLVAVLYAQMTVILFEDVKRTEPFARLARAPPEGVKAYGTLLQTPRAWWSIFFDICFRRKKIGSTSLALFCVALVNVIALLAISPLSSALLTSEEVLIPKTVEFTRIVPKNNTQLSMQPSRDTYYRMLNAALRNVSTSAWVTDNLTTFPFWPSSEAAQFGPHLSSTYGTWDMETITIQSSFKCQNMTLKSAEISDKRYSGVYVMQGYGPLNGTQPMVTFELESDDQCKYNLSIHPAVDLAGHGGMTWSSASTFFPTSPAGIKLGGRVFLSNMTSTDIYSRVDASAQCNGRDIIIISTPYTTKASTEQPGPQRGFLPQNGTYEKSPDFRMRALLCDSHFRTKRHVVKATMSETPLDTVFEDIGDYEDIQDGLIDIAQFQARSTQDNWESYMDGDSMQAESYHTNVARSGVTPGYSGMAPILAARSRFNLTSILDDPSIPEQAARLKGRFFSETLRNSFTSAELIDTEVFMGKATIVEERVVVLTEIGYALAALFFASSALLAATMWQSRAPHRPLNLQSDPSSAIGMSLLLNQPVLRSSVLRSMHNRSRVDFYTALQGEKYLTIDHELLKGDDNSEPPVKVKAKSNWRPGAIRIRWLLVNSLALTTVLVGILVLNALSARSKLSQLAFIYEADISKFKLSFSTFAPISILPTLLSIAIALTWDQLDSTFRALQPFISMSRGPTPICDGAGLTYRSKSWLGAAIKAGRKRHWVLFMISVGSILTQVLTVSMAALFEREARNVVRAVSLPRGLEMRQVPIISEANTTDTSKPPDPTIQALEGLYMDVSKNWLYGAGIQHTYNGSELPWTAAGWSFLPVDFANILDGTAMRSASVQGVEDSSQFSGNVTLSTSAIRARLQCRAIQEVANVSSWVEGVHLNNEDDIWRAAEFAQIENTTKTDSYELRHHMFAGTNSHTTLSVEFGRGRDTVRCCGNGTRSNPSQAIFGFWSPIFPPEHTEVDFPYASLKWPLSISAKWIVGKPFNLTTGQSTKNLFFTEVPQIQAARCEPIIETNEATVTVDPRTGRVISFEMDETAVNADAAWVDVFTNYDGNERSKGLGNVTASYGVLFLDSLLGTSHRASNAFSYQDENSGISMDLMTYSMFALADKKPEALLNFTTMAAHADRTFQTFFQQFVNTGLSLTKGGYAYQPINDDSMKLVGTPIGPNNAVLPEKTFPVLNTSRIITVSASHRIRVLTLNPIATYLSTAILIWLILTTLIVTCLQRSCTGFMNRDVQLIADMLILVAGSDNFLDLVAQKGVELKKNKDIKTMLGWFIDRDGQVRWGIEVVGGRNAVRWVDEPKQGFHIPVPSRNIFAWSR